MTDQQGPISEEVISAVRDEDARVSWLAYGKAPHDARIKMAAGSTGASGSFDGATPEIIRGERTVFGLQDGGVIYTSWHPNGLEDELTLYYRNASKGVPDTPLLTRYHGLVINEIQVVTVSHGTLLVLCRSNAHCLREFIDCPDLELFRISEEIEDCDFMQFGVLMFQLDDLLDDNTPAAAAPFAIAASKSKAGLISGMAAASGRLVLTRESYKPDEGFRLTLLRVMDGKIKFVAEALLPMRDPQHIALSANARRISILSLHSELLVLDWCFIVARYEEIRARCPETTGFSHAYPPLPSSPIRGSGEQLNDAEVEAGYGTLETALLERLCDMTQVPPEQRRSLRGLPVARAGRTVSARSAAVATHASVNHRVRKSWRDRRKHRVLGNRIKDHLTHRAGIVPQPTHESSLGRPLREPTARESSAHTLPTGCKERTAKCDKANCKDGKDSDRQELAEVPQNAHARHISDDIGYFRRPPPVPKLLVDLEGLAARLVVDRDAPQNNLALGDAFVQFENSLRATETDSDARPVQVRDDGPTEYAAAQTTEQPPNVPRSFPNWSAYIDRIIASGVNDPPSHTIPVTRGCVPNHSGNGSPATAVDADNTEITGGLRASEASTAAVNAGAEIASVAEDVVAHPMAHSTSSDACLTVDPAQLSCIDGDEVSENTIVGTRFANWNIIQANDDPNGGGIVDMAVEAPSDSYQFMWCYDKSLPGFINSRLVHTCDFARGEMPYVGPLDSSVYATYFTDKREDRAVYVVPKDEVVPLRMNATSIDVDSFGSHVMVGYEGGVIELFDAINYVLPLSTVRVMDSDCLALGFSKYGQGLALAVGNIPDTIVEIDWRRLRLREPVWRMPCDPQSEVSKRLFERLRAIDKRYAKRRQNGRINHLRHEWRKMRESYERLVVLMGLPCSAIARYVPKYQFEFIEEDFGVYAKYREAVSLKHRTFVQHERHYRFEIPASLSDLEWPCDPADADRLERNDWWIIPEGTSASAP